MATADGRTQQEPSIHADQDAYARTREKRAQNLLRVYQADTVLAELESVLDDVRAKVLPPDQLTTRLRDELRAGVSAAVPVVERAYEIPFAMPADEAAAYQRRLDAVIEDAVSGARPTDSAPPANVLDLLNEVVAADPEAVTMDGTLEAAATEMIGGVEAIAGSLPDLPEVGAGERSENEDLGRERRPSRLSSRQLDQVFQKLKVHVHQSRHHVRGFVVVDGRPAIAVYYSLGRSEFPRAVSERLRRSLFLSPQEFDELVSCSLTRDQYLHLLRDRIR